MIGNSNDESNFPHKILLTNRQVLRLLKASANNSSTINLKLKKQTELYKLVQSGGFSGRLLVPLMKNVKP